MKVRVSAAALLAAFFLQGDLQACGDKFLAVGRGIRFQKAYAAIHPASILILLPAKSVNDAALRDSRLHTALKMAGHKVDIVQPTANLSDVLNRSRYEIILAERVDVPSIPNVTPAGGAKPTVIAVIEDRVPGDAVAPASVGRVLRTPQPLPQILNFLDDVMKERVDSARRATGAAH
jgi:hypothetical protein